ncbi:MAG: ABC transporter permease [Chloroflexi bacterium]|nr:ABC transporter permease [Chloroflexota bacterium]
MTSMATPLEAGDFAGRPTPRFRFLRELVHKKIAMIAIFFLAIFYLAGIFAPWVSTDDPNYQRLTIEDRLAAPSGDHWFGTDGAGRDLFSRVVYSARTTLLFTLVVILTGSLFLGLGLGLLAGYRGGWIDAGIMRVGEVLSGVPTLLLMLAISAAFRTRLNDVAFWLQENTFLGDDARAIVPFLIIVGAALPFAWIGSARIVRSQVFAIREQEYVLAAETIGVSTARLLLRHVFPGVLPIFLVGVSAGMAGIAGSEIALSYLGLGVDPSTPSFGTLLQNAGGVRTFQEFPHMLLVSGVPLILFFFSWNLLGDALVDIVEPRTYRR